MADAGAEAHRVHGAHLANHLGQVLQFSRGLESELFGITGVMKLLRLQAQG